MSPRVHELRRDYDALCLTIGAETPRDLPVPGRVLSGIELAMPFLAQQNRREAGATIDPAEAIDVRRGASLMTPVTHLPTYGLTHFSLTYPAVPYAVDPTR